MYGLPAHLDLSEFIGRELELVSFTLNTVFMAFDEDLSLTILSSYEHGDRTGEHSEGIQTVPPMQSRLMRLIGRRIVRAEGSNQGVLTLYFDDGQMLACYDDSPQYESYRIAHGDDEVIV